MRKSARSVVVALTSAGVLAVTAGLTSPPASATVCTAVVLSPRIPNLVLSETGRLSVRVSVDAYDNCSSIPGAEPGIHWVVVTAVNPGKDVVETSLYRTSGTARRGTWTGTMHFDRTSNVGTWSVDVAAADSDQEVVNLREDTFKLRRDTRVTANARPEPARHGGVVTVTGHVEKLTVRLRYVDLRHRDVRIYFQRAGTSTRNFKATVTTNRHGRFARTFAATRTGRWYAYVPGTDANTNKWSAGDWVRVR